MRGERPLTSDDDQSRVFYREVPDSNSWPSRNAAFSLTLDLLRDITGYLIEDDAGQLEVGGHAELVRLIDLAIAALQQQRTTVDRKDQP